MSCIHAEVTWLRQQPAGCVAERMGRLMEAAHSFSIFERGVSAEGQVMWSNNMDGHPNSMRALVGIPAPLVHGPAGLHAVRSTAMQAS